MNVIRGGISSDFFFLFFFQGLKGRIHVINVWYITYTSDYVP